MTRKHPLLGAASLSLAFGLVVACGGSVTPIHEAGDDSGAPDASTPDSTPVGHDSGPVSNDSGGNDSGTGPKDSSSADTGPAPLPVYHRPNDTQCLQPPAAGTCTFMFPGDSGPEFGCSTDSQCTNGTNGRCQESGGGPAGCFCSYDTCTDDSACPTGQLCVCHGSAYAAGIGNTCEPGNCRVDADCGANGYCSPAHGTQGCGGVTGYYCHTTADECVNDSDCANVPVDGFGPPICTWSAGANHWTCQASNECA